MKKHTEDKGISTVFILLFMVVVLAVALYFGWRAISPQMPSTPVQQNANPVQQLFGAATPVPTPTPKPAPIPLKPDTGTRGTFQVGMGAHTGPNIGQVTLDPLDVKNGQTLNVTVAATYSQPITNVSAVLSEDNGSQNISFQLTSGTSTNGVWSGSVTLTSPVDYTYIVRFTIKASDGTSSSAPVGLRV